MGQLRSQGARGASREAIDLPAELDFEPGRTGEDPWRSSTPVTGDRASGEVAAEVHAGLLDPVPLLERLDVVLHAPARAVGRHPEVREDR